MLKDGADIYEPVSMSHVAALIVVMAICVGYASYRLYGYLRVQIAIQKQSALLAKRIPEQNNIIDTAIVQLQIVAQKVHAAETSIDTGAHQASYILRDAFDKVMNHHTIYQSKTEVQDRHLQGLGASLEHAYPLEFDLKTASIATPDHFQSLVNTATEVLNGCR